MKRETALLALLALVVLCGCALLQLASPYYFLWDDNATYYLPVYTFNGEALFGAGELAHLNYRQYLGTPHLAAGQTGVLYPPVYLALAMAEIGWGDPRATVDLLVVFHLAAAAVFLFLLLRELGVERRESFLAALLWVSFPFVVVVSRSWVFVSYAAALLPANLWLLERLVKKPVASRILAFAAAKALFVLQGYVQYAVLAGMFEVVWLLLRWTLLRRSPTFPARTLAAKAYVASLAAGAALAAPVVLPMLRAKQVSAYRATSLSFEELISNALEVGTLLRAQIGFIDPRAIHLTSGAMFYIGLPILLLLALFLRRRVGLAALGAAVLALILSTSAWGVFHSAPLLSSFRWPFKGFLVALLYFTVAAALAASRKPGRRTTLLLTLGILGNVAILAVPQWTLPFGPNRVDRDVAAVRAEVAEQVDPSAGRVVSLWMHPNEERIDRLLAFNFATLAQAYHLGGYDPLISAEHLWLAKNLEYSNIFRYPLNRQSLDYLSSWSVRYLLVPRRAEYQAVFAQLPELRLKYRDEKREVWENTAAEPFARWLSDSGSAEVGLAGVDRARVEWGFSGLRILTDGASGRLRLNIAPLPWYFATAHGAEEGDRDEQELELIWDEQRQLLLDIPAGTREVELRWVDVPFRIGMAICLILLLAVGAIAFRRRRATAAGVVTGVVTAVVTAMVVVGESVNSA